MNAEGPTGAAGRRWTPPSPPAGDGLGDVTLRAGAALPSAARAAVADWLMGRVPSTVLGDAQLLVSELVTNSYLHAGQGTGAPVRIRAGSTDGSIWVEVGDGGSDGAVARRPPMAQGAGGGFGLHLVDHVASQWGVTHVRGTQVWFILAFTTAPED